jgi:hypothetical protein
MPRRSVGGARQADPCSQSLEAWLLGRLPPDCGLIRFRGAASAWRTSGLLLAAASAWREIWAAASAWRERATRCTRRAARMYLLLP